jgi:hypothetical protein
MKWRKYIDADYPMIAEWFVKHGWPVAPEKSILSTMGFIVTDDNDDPLAVGFLYISNSAMAIVDWIATNPKLRGLESVRVLEYLWNSVKEVATELKVGVILHFSLPKYAKVYEKKFGFKQGETLQSLVWRVE